MEWLLTNGGALLLVPPGSLLVLAALGLLLARPRPRLGKSLVWAALLALYLLSTSYVSDRLLQTLESEPAVIDAASSAQAIVVLGSGVYVAAPEYSGSDTVKVQTLPRLRYAAHLHRLTQKPVLVSGGNPQGGPSAEALLMKTALERDFGTPVRWVEDQSNTTLENARMSRLVLENAGIHRIWLVTHAWHMPRARMAFENAGFGVIPAPVEFATRHRLGLRHFLPHAEALWHSSRFFHEIIGIAWYRLKFLLGR
ncbi:MAG: YdcF family protein [Burkholderiales bacterium]